MITPKFSLSQTDAAIILHVYAPYTNVKDTEIEVLDESVIFYSTPYYLRLNLPGKVHETDESSAHYDADNGKYVITVCKVNHGEHFPNLEMLTSLLQPKAKKTRIKPLIEVIGEDGVKEHSSALEEEISEDDWFIEQTVVEEEMPSCSSSILLKQYSYGFLNRHSGLLDKYSLELGEVAEIQNPDSLSESERRKLREEHELAKFSEDHYLADLMENEEVGRALQFTLDKASLQQLTEQNKETMKDLGNREFLFDNKTSVKRVYLGMVDILHAYCYDWRVTEGTHCCESPWNISRLSGTLSWFDTFDSIHEVVHCCIRRSLSYPLIRHWKLSQKVMKDVVAVLKLGPVAILICLLDILVMFRKKEPYYLLNQLYIEEYCVWVQHISDTCTTLPSITVALEKVCGSYAREQVGFDLVELEAAAAACEDEEMEEDISSIVRNVRLS